MESQPAATRLEQGAHDYVTGAASTDPLFRALRRKHYERADGWVVLGLGEASAGSVFFAKTGLKAGPIPCRGLLSAFGWETRPFDRSSSLGPAECSALVRALRGHGDWDVAHLTSLLPSEAELLAQAAREEGVAAILAPCPTRVITGGIDHATYMAGRSASTLKEWRRTFRKAQNKGLRYETELAWDDIRLLFEAKQLKATSEDYTKTSEFLAFFREFRDEMKKQGRMCEVGLFHNSMLVAFDLGFWTGKVLHCYQTAYHPGYQEDRPGALVFERLIERGFEGGASLIDFMGDYPYMAHFSKEVLNLRRATFYARSPRGRAASALLALKARLKRP